MIFGTIVNVWRISRYEYVNSSVFYMNETYEDIYKFCLVCKNLNWDLWPYINNISDSVQLVSTEWQLFLNLHKFNYLHKYETKKKL